MREYRDDAPHLFDTRPRGWRGGSSLMADGDYEGVCTCCGARVTVGPDGAEYGHGYRCPHRPGHLPVRQTRENEISEHICPTCGRGDFESSRAVKCHHVQIHDERLDAERTCPVCDDVFELPVGGSSEQTYCSRVCRDVAQRERVVRTCETCDEPFERIPYRLEHDAGRYCSHRCQAQAQASDPDHAFGGDTRSGGVAGD